MDILDVKVFPGDYEGSSIILVVKSVVTLSARDAQAVVSTSCLLKRVDRVGSLLVRWSRPSHLWSLLRGKFRGTIIAVLAMHIFR